MAEYIKKENVIANLERFARDPYHETHYIREAVINTIRRMEAADVLPVVRCKDCKWKANTRWCDFHEFTILSDDDFCSYGERKDHEID